jgi:hypothetical protein
MWPLSRKYRDATMIHPLEFVDNLALARTALRNPALRHGAVIECGTWRGGMSAALMEVCGARDYLFFDSFEGLPPATEFDGPRAFDYQAEGDDPEYHDNCTASEAEFRATIARASAPGRRVQVFKGFFDQTLPGFAAPPVAILRLDADWYDSTMICLDTFWDALLPDALVLIDDYRAWDGCARAVHDFLSKRKAVERICTSALAPVTYLLKAA